MNACVHIATCYYLQVVNFEYRHSQQQSLHGSVKKSTFCFAWSEMNTNFIKKKTKRKVNKTQWRTKKLRKRTEKRQLRRKKTQQAKQNDHATDREVSTPNKSNDHRPCGDRKANMVSSRAHLPMNYIWSAPKRKNVFSAYIRALVFLA